MILIFEEIKCLQSNEVGYFSSFRGMSVDNCSVSGVSVYCPAVAIGCPYSLYMFNMMDFDLLLDLNNSKGSLAIV